MKKFFKKKFIELPLHPYLLIGYLSLLFISNDLETGFPIETIYLPMGLLFFIVSAILISFHFFGRDYKHIAIFLTIFIFINYAAYPLYEIIGDILENLFFFRQLYFFIFLTLFMCCVFFILRMRFIKQNVGQITIVLNIICVILLFQVCASIVVLSLSDTDPMQKHPLDVSFDENPLFPQLNVSNSLNERDYYFLIVDRYPGKESLTEFCDFDNSEFLNNLKSFGFTVITNSSSNTGSTSTFTDIVMNLNYTYYPYELGYYHKNGYQLIDFFKINGFKTYGAYSHHLPLYKKQKKMELDEILNHHDGSILPAISDEIPQLIVIEFIRNSYIGAIIELIDQRFETQIFSSLIDSDVLKEYTKWIIATRSSPDTQKQLFSHVGNVSFVPDTTFTYVHFNGIGGMSGNKSEYLNRVKEINHQIEEMIGCILHNSEKKPVIVLLSDHGDYPALKSNEKYQSDIEPHKEFIEQWGCYFEEGACKGDNIGSNYMVNNFQAYYLPDGGDMVLYETITSVNAWRMILNYYFHGSLSRLDDISYWKGQNGWYKVRENGQSMNCMKVSFPTNDSTV